VGVCAVCAACSAHGACPCAPCTDSTPVSVRASIFGNFVCPRKSALKCLLHPYSNPYSPASAGRPPFSLSVSLPAFFAVGDTLSRAPNRVARPAASGAGQSISPKLFVERPIRPHWFAYRPIYNHDVTGSAASRSLASRPDRYSDERPRSGRLDKQTRRANKTDVEASASPQHVWRTRYAEHRRCRRLCCAAAVGIGGGGGSAIAALGARHNMAEHRAASLRTEARAGLQSAPCRVRGVATKSQQRANQ
jgi:hypothetical protein